MRLRTPVLVAACGFVLLAVAALPADASGLRFARPTSEGTVDAADLLAELTDCEQISQGTYRTDQEKPATVPVCGAKGAVFWKADMDIDCDGQRTDRCNERTDPWFQPDTAIHQSDGKPLKSDALPYIVVPNTSDIWDHTAAGIGVGDVAAVIRGDRVVYAVVGDTGPKEIIGEASYAAAQALDIDPDPSTGGADSGVTYLVFKNAKADPVESHAAAVALGDRLAGQFLRDN